MDAARRDTVTALFSQGRSASDAESGNSARPVEAVTFLGALFPTASRVECTLLQRAMQRLRLPPEADRNVLAYALAAASGGDCMVARQVIERSALPFVAGDAGTGTGSLAIAGSRDERLDAPAMRRLAQLLARTDAGFATLHALHPANAALGRAARLLLQVGDAGLAPPGDDARCDLQSASSLAARVRAAATRMLDPAAELSLAEKGAIFAWEQGFREDGVGSALQSVKRELSKFAHTTIPRVESSRLRSFLPRLFGKKKSPLSAMQRGMQGAHRPGVKRETAALNQARQQAIGCLYAELRRDTPALLRQAEPITALAALATLAHGCNNATTARRGRADPEALRDIVGHMHRILQTLPESERQRRPAAFLRLLETLAALDQDPRRALRTLPGLRRMLRAPLSVKRLAAWARLRSVPPHAPFWACLRRCRTLQRPADLRPAARCRHSARQALHTLIGNMESSGRVRFADGAQHGVNTKGLTVNLSHLLNLTGLPFGPRLLLALQRGRTAIVEIGRADHAGEILIGHDRHRRHTVGAGFVAGFDYRALGGKVRCGAALDLAHARERRRTRGMLLRVARRARTDGTGSDDLRLRACMRRVVDFLFDQSERGKTPDREYLFNRFAAAFFDDPDLSVSWSGEASHARDTSGGCSISALVQVPGTRLRGGPAVGAGASCSGLTQGNHDEAGGRLQSRSQRLEAERRITLMAGLNGKLAGTTQNHSGVTTGDIGAFNAELPELRVTAYQNGHAARMRLVRENGVLQPRACLLAFEFSRWEQYATAVLANREQWIDHLQANFNDAPNARQRAVEALETYLENARCNARINQRFVQRASLRPEAARRIDRHDVAIDLIRANLHLPVQQREDACRLLEARSEALLREAGSWQPAELKVVEKSTRLRRRGFLLGLQMASEHSADGERKLTALAVRPGPQVPPPGSQKRQYDVTGEEAGARRVTAG